MSLAQDLHRSSFDTVSGYRDVSFGVKWRCCFPVEMPVDALNSCFNSVKTARAVVETRVEACEMACVGVEAEFSW